MVIYDGTPITVGSVIKYFWHVDQRIHNGIVLKMLSGAIVTEKGLDSTESVVPVLVKDTGSSWTLSRVDQC